MRASSAPPRLLRASAPLAVSLWTIPVHPTVFSAACKSCQPAGLQPAPCTFPRLQSLPVKASLGQRRRVASSSPAQSRPRPSQNHTSCFSPCLDLCHQANHLPNLSGQSYSQNQLAPNTLSASFLLTLFSLTAPQSSRSHPLNWTTTTPAEHNTHLPCALGLLRTVQRCLPSFRTPSQPSPT